VYKPTKKDSGIYMIQAENDHGKETLKHEVNFRVKEEFSNIKQHIFYHADSKDDFKRLRPHEKELLRLKEEEVEEERRRSCRERIAIKAAAEAEKLRLEEEEAKRLQDEADKAERLARGEVEEEEEDWSGGKQIINFSLSIFHFMFHWI
jgi:hypothetical protein